MVVQLFTPSGLDSHCIVNELEPPEMEAVKSAVPPIQISFTAGVTEIVASARTTTVALLETGSLQPEKGSVIIALYNVVPAVVVGGEYVNDVAPEIL